ncbi:MAG: C4-type zinc ribbon domain-containing protein [Pyrinomonadaceae bacterium]
MKSELQQLIALQKADTKIRTLQAELDAIPQKRAEIEKEFEQRAFEFRAVEAKRNEALAARARFENEILETKSRSDRAERNLMSSQNQKDYEAAIREIDAAKKQISQFETQVLEQMDLLEQSEKEFKEREPEVETLRAEMSEKFAAFEQQMKTQGAELGAAREHRDSLLQALPRQMGALYKRLSSRIRDGVAVAEARNNSCTACHMSLRPQVMTQIRRGEDVIVCDNCNRILYYLPREAAPSGSSAATTV